MGYNGFTRFTLVFHLSSWICLKFSQSKSGVGLDAWKAHVRVICRVLTCLDVLAEKTHLWSNHEKPNPLDPSGNFT
jgi:hypothetical protein